MLGLDARGFLFGPLIALRLGAAFAPVRKAGKLPGECARAVYAKEYGEVCVNLTVGDQWMHCESHGRWL